MFHHEISNGFHILVAIENGNPGPGMADSIRRIFQELGKGELSGL